MGMNILGLNAREATLIKPNTASQTYRINQAKVKADIQSGNVTGDLLQLSNQSAEKIAGLATSGDVRKSSNNYSLEAFFRKDMPKMTNADGSYSIGNVTFTEEELVKAKNVMQTAAKQINGDAGIKSNLDYKDYAMMALAEKAVGDYAKEHFNEAQQQVIADAMKSYNEGLEDLQRDVIQNDLYEENSNAKSGTYYGLSPVLSQTQADAINRLKEEISRVSGNKEYKKSESGEIAGVATIATNKELINQMKSLFAEVDPTDTKQLQGAMDKYRELLRPAYNAFGFEKNVDKNISDDISGFLQKLQKIQASEAGRGVDYTV